MALRLFCCPVSLHTRHDAGLLYLATTSLKAVPVVDCALALVSSHVAFRDV